ncbi:protein-tyrosine phosphatase-like protein, partial [Tribonema minus]
TLKRRKLQGVILVSDSSPQHQTWRQAFARLLEDEKVAVVLLAEWEPFLHAYPFICHPEQIADAPYYPSEIITPAKGHGGLYLSGYQVPTNPDVLRHLNIKRIIDASTLDDIREQWAYSGIRYMTIDIEDDPDDNVAQYFPAAIAFISEGLEAGEGVLVHCMAGASRSASIVMAFIMQREGWPIERGYDYVYGNRNQVYVNLGFRRQLADWE